mgnify:CR=1 FL=1
MVDQSSWDAHAAHPLQSWAWGEFRQAMGVETVRIAHKENEMWQLTFHKIPHTPFTVGYFPKGPMPTKTMLRKLAEVGKQKRAIFIQLEPNIQKKEAGRLQTLPLRPSHRPLFTAYNFVLDIRPSETELLQNMHHKTRYNIRLAQKHNVTIAEETSQEGFAAYLTLLNETIKRQGFYAHNELYHTRMWNTMSTAGIAKLFTARLNGYPLAAWIIFAFGDTIYYPYGASSREHREVMAPNLLLWEIVRWGKARGFSYFDLWGALGPTPDPKDPWYGFHRFKEGYRPTHVEYAGSFDFVLRPTWYSLYTMADNLRWMLLNTKK